MESIQEEDVSHVTALQSTPQVNSARIVERALARKVSEGTNALDACLDTSTWLQQVGHINSISVSK